MSSANTILTPKCTVHLQRDKKTVSPSGCNALLIVVLQVAALDAERMGNGFERLPRNRARILLCASSCRGVTYFNFHPSSASGSFAVQLPYDCDDVMLSHFIELSFDGAKVVFDRLCSLRYLVHFDGTRVTPFLAPPSSSRTLLACTLFPFIPCLLFLSRGLESNIHLPFSQSWNRRSI